MTKKQRNKRVWKKWQRLVSEQAASAQTISGFCRERGLGRQSFFAWRKRLSGLSQPKPKPFVEVKVAKPAEPAVSDAAIEVRLREQSQSDGTAGFRRESCTRTNSDAGGRMIGLPSLNSLDRAQGARIWLATEAADMRCGFDRLAERVRAVIGEDPQSGRLFVFRSRRGDRLKILVWDRDGFVLWYKRLEAGVFKLPCVGEGKRSVELRGERVGHGAGWD